MTRELRADRLTCRAGGRTILRNVSLHAGVGEMLAVSGPSGSGKSTLLICLAGLERPAEGEVLLDGIPIERVHGWRRRVGLVLQNHGLVPVLTAAENVALPLQATGCPRAEVAKRTLQSLAAVGLERMVERLVEDLSGGQRQRVALARALAGDPEVVIADEPTSELDAEHRGQVMAMLLSEARRGRIVVIASHDPEVVEACDRELALRDGTSIAQR